MLRRVVFQGVYRTASEVVGKNFITGLLHERFKLGGSSRISRDIVDVVEVTEKVRGDRLRLGGSKEDE